MAGNTGAIRAGRAFVEIGGNDSPLSAVLKRVESKLQNFGGKVAGIGAAAAAAGAAVLAPFSAAVSSFVEAGSALQDMSDRTGASVENLSALSFAAQQTGTSLDSVESAIKKTQRAIVEGAAGSQKQIELFDQLGLSIADLVAMTPDQQFNAVATAIAGVEDPTQRAAMAMEAFGKSGTSILPMLANLPLLTDQARALGVVMSTEDAAAADALGDAFDQLKAAASGVSNIIGATLAPILTEYAKQATAAIQVAAGWIDQNRSLVVTIAKVAAGVTVAGGVIVAFGGSLLLAGSAAGALNTVIAAGASIRAALFASTVAQTSANVALAGSMATVKALSGVGIPVLLASVAAAGAAVVAIKKLADGYSDLAGNIGEAIDKKIKANEVLASTPDATAGATGETAAPSGNRASNDSIRALHEQRLQNIENEHERELNLMIFRGETEIQLAREAGANDQTIATMRQTLAEKLGKLERDLQNKKHQEELQHIKEREDAEKQKQQRVKDAEENRADTIAELEIENSDLSDDDKKRAQLNLRKLIALREAEAAGESLDAVKEEFRIRSELLEKELAANAGIGAANAFSRKLEVAGTFNASAAYGLAGGGDFQERTARAAEKTANGVERLVQGSRTNRLVFTGG